MVRPAKGCSVTADVHAEDDVWKGQGAVLRLQTGRLKQLERRMAVGESVADGGIE